MKIKNIYDRLKKEKIRYVLILINIFFSYFLKSFRPKYFYFNNKKYPYYNGRYTFAWRNERSIEIPLIMDTIKKKENSDILEIGNVIKHHFSFPHDIIDKYEKSKNVINEDVVDFKLNKKYDLIFSISTIEHVGWDEHKKDPNKIEKSIINLKKHLKKNGQIIITVPTGYNPYLDKLLLKNTLFSKIYFFKRDPFNIWGQASFDEIKKCRYGLDRAKGLALILIN